MGTSILLVVSVASAVLLACGVAWAAGDLDPAFGGGDGQVVSTEPCFRCGVSDI